jgi:hypothetical protein
VLRSRILPEAGGIPLNDHGMSGRPDQVEARDADSCKPTLGVEATPKVAAIMAGDGPDPEGRRSKMSRRLRPEEASRRDVHAWAHSELNGSGPRSRPTGLRVSRNLGSQEFRVVKVPRVRAHARPPSGCLLERRNPLVNKEMTNRHSRTFRLATMLPISIRR